MSSNPAECTILSLWYHRHGDFFIMSEFVSLWLKFMDRWPRHGQCAYMCLTARTLAMTGKEASVLKQCSPQWLRHLHKGAMCHGRETVIHLYHHCERGAFMRRTRQSSGGQRYSVPMAQVCGSVAAPRAVRVYVPDGTDAHDDGEKMRTGLWIGGRATGSARICA